VARKRVAQSADIQLAARVPGELRQRLRLHCVARDITMTAFVVAAIRERLARDGRRRQRM
jgi:hypothetical protein